MSAFITWAVVILGAVMGLLVLYSNKKFTFPTYTGAGGWLHLIIAGGLGILALFLFGKLVGAENIFTMIGNHFEFAMAHGGYMQGSAITLGIGLLGIAGVASYNLANNGRAVM